MIEEVHDAGWATIPNAVTLVRFFAVFYFVWLLIYQDDPQTAAIVFVVIGATDWIDGFLARALNQTSEIGRLMDPIVDRFALATAVIAGMVVGIVPLWLGVPLILREVVMAIAAGLLLRRTGETIHVRWIGKLSTFLLYASIPGLYLAAAGLIPDVLRPLSLAVGGVGLVIYLVVAGQYLSEIRNKLR